MEKMNNSKRLISFGIVSLALLSVLCHKGFADETKWLAVGMLHDWYSSTGCEIEVGRTHLIPDQQDGLRWPALYRYQDTKAAKAFWIGTANFDDPVAAKTFPFKVVHVGPRGLDETNEFITNPDDPGTFQLIAKFDHPRVFVDGIPASQLDFLDFVDTVNTAIPSDRLLYNEVITSIGIKMIRKIYAYSQINHNNYFIYDYTFVNTGIINLAGTKIDQRLDGVVFFWQYRYAPSREGGPYGTGGYWMPQSTAWGHSTMNDAIYTHPDGSGNPFRALFTWLGRHSLWGGPSGTSVIGGPNFDTDGHLAASQYCGTLVLHADRSPQDRSDDPAQPTSTHPVGSDDPITSPNDQYNEPRMTVEYAAMTKGRPDPTQAGTVGDGFANDIGFGDVGQHPGGFSQAHGFGPYVMEPGDSIHIVIAESVAGLSREKNREVGAAWLADTGPFILPDGSEAASAEEYKNEWVFTGEDSLFQTLDRARLTYEDDFNVPHPPPPPEEFTVVSGGDRIILSWANNSEIAPTFSGYRLYRALFTPDTTFDLIFECGGNSGNPIANEFSDTTPKRGFDYYYYVTAFDDGSVNDYNPGVRMESSLFYTITNEPAFLRRPAGKTLTDIRVVPNPYNIRARDIQFGISAPDRIMFLNIPPLCTIKIFTERGDLIQTLEHTDGSGDEPWNSVTSSRQTVVSGVYIAYIEVTEDALDPETGALLFKKGDHRIVKFVIIR